MASSRQLKQHARFHAAVLRYLFPPPPDSSDFNTHQEAVHQNHEEDYFQVQLPKSAELAAEEEHSDHEGVEVGKASLSRAQRKRLKLKKVKERQSDAMPAKKLIGPLLSDLLEKRRHGFDDLKSAGSLLQEDGTAEKCHTPTNTGERQDVHDGSLLQEDGTAEKCHTPTNTGERQDVHDAGEHESLSTGTEEEKHMHNAGELEPLCTNTVEGKDVHDGAEPQFLSRAKRRRLAKKKFHNNLPRRPIAGSSFTAEIKGEDIIIKQIL